MRKTYVGDGQNERTDCGLSELGVEVVRRMNDVGMVVDLSHAGSRTALDAIDVSQAPVVFSHNAAHALWPTPRTRCDEDFVACANKVCCVARSAEELVGGVRARAAGPDVYSFYQTFVW